jgi:hypothetical protein
MTTQTASASSNLPVVGTHGSYSVGSDSYPCTVVAVSRSGHQVTVQNDSYRVSSGSEQTGDVVYEFARNLEGGTQVFTRRANGRYRRAGAKHGSLYLQHGWQAHQDPSF